MIIFYKKDGQIVGTIEGRVHGEAHLKMWIGDKATTERIVVQWKAVKDIKDKTGRVIAQDFAPESTQPEVFVELDKKPSDIFKYKVDVKTKTLILK